MPSVAPAVELLPEPRTGRVFSISGRVRLGDVDVGGRMRLDSTARFMQDAATDDATDAELDRAYGWLVRRTLIETSAPAVLGERIEVATWCSGLGRAWAERRTRITGDRGAHVDAVSLWVQIELTSGRPARVGDDFQAAYAEAADGRTVTARLALPAASESSASDLDRWVTRRTDLDPFGHVNNAATWAFLEEVARPDTTDRIGRAEMEYLQAIEPPHGTSGHPRVCVTNDDDLTTAWLVTSGTPIAAARWAPSPGRPAGSTQDDAGVAV